MSNVINITTKAPVDPIAERARVRDLLAESVVHVFVGGEQIPVTVRACGRIFDSERDVLVEEEYEQEDGTQLSWRGSLKEWQDAIARALSAAGVV